MQGKACGRQEREEADEYEELFLGVAGRVEKMAVAVLVVLLSLLLASQLLLQNPRIRYLLVRVEQLEGTPYGEHGALVRSGP
ncbi:hypothetical protein [Paenibacillus mucilaginosus]|uniref:Uncharacterized protein n=3 Tax=Paenibacillus mucilaginosus TaxID=61624 RepID=H6NMK3_9BACL|nr:hypothetical protein [Paenibacillus mucilaginosus]AFC29869.1 hypothetical protein PM3016_3001 [Paenibacillus mucilaginosus 3016]AFH62054.1 hypothetical protein B2K_15220 [Paenibacillus mucilaginosus K02]MCG7211260.1 hypothetical protein [Paenibacillus mucilaginosus]WDM30349.1 hypothetical protein KCX80_14885 [Paenibacillus mucilaginosus]WFA18533.1 hypothetical protein ERY13_15245 [Paenibacillus mucilaginosus]